MADDYVAQVRAMRKEKDEAFARDPNSPIPQDDKHHFQGLKYYEPDPRLKVQARWEPNAAPPVVTMSTSTGDARDYLVAGTLRFEVEGQEVTLQALQPPGAHELFLPFRDATSGKETYGAGRYLEVPLPHGERVEIDFNLAYNPFCAYDDAYSCPFPPPPNWLKVPIRAGEKTYKDM